MTSTPQSGPVIPVDELLSAYSKGWFPMCHADGELYWHDPDPRAIVPLDRVRPDQRTARHIRSLVHTRRELTVTFDQDFAAVIRACAERDETWIDERIIASYCALHEAGQAHSVEVWEQERLVGGVYGVAVGAAFFGESMFSRRSNAAKVAFHALVDQLKACNFILFDAQYANAFTRKLGVEEVPRAAFRRSLARALAMPTRFCR